MIKRVFILSILLAMSSLMAKESIVLIDDSKKGKLTQEKIKGCDDIAIVKEQKKDIEDIKRQLSIILKKLSEMEREEKGVKKSITKIKRKKGSYITVKVKRGDRLTDYAKKYYGNSRLYYRIYKANRDKIGTDLKLRVGDRIIIPIDQHHKHKKLYNRKRRVVQDIDIPTKNSVIVPEINYSRAKFIFPNNRDSNIKILDEPVYIDDEETPKDISGFIPLDEN